MSGSCIGDWMEKNFQNEMKKLDPNKYYGMMIFDNKVVVDGACGFSSMERILEALGWQLEKLRVSGDVYLLTKKRTTMKELEKHPKGWNMHSQALRDMGYTMLGWRNDDAFVIPEGRKFHSVTYNERCKTLYICPETKEYYMLDSGD